jgi:hypothetical protein
MNSFTALETKIIIPSFRQEKLISLISKLNKRAAKIGVPSLKYSVNPETIIRTVNNGYKAEFVEVTVSGNIPAYNGWSVIAVIDHLDTGSVVKNLTKGEFTIPEMYWTRGSVCDHCKTKHRRNKTILIKKDDELMQIGSSCINSFVEKDVLSVIGFLEWDRTIEEFGDEEDRMGGSYIPGEELDILIKTTIRIIKTVGFKKSSEENSTKSNLEYYFYNKTEGAAKFRQFVFEKTSDLDINKLATGFMTWIKESEPSSEFIINLKTLAAGKFVEVKYWGFIAGGLASYLRSIDTKKDTENSINEYLIGAEVGKRFKTTLILDGIYPNDGYYGITYRHIFHDNDGRKAVWFSSGKSMDNDMIGKEVIITASVKDLGEYKGSKQTVLTRVKW